MFELLQRSLVIPAPLARLCGGGGAILLAACLLAACDLTADPATPDQAASGGKATVESVSGTGAQFEVGPLQTRNLGGGEGLIDAEIQFQITNAGAADLADPVAVAVTFDGEGSETVEEIEAFAAGSSQLVTFVRKLSAGSHQVLIDVAGQQIVREILVGSADLALAASADPVLGSDTVQFSYRLENTGDQPAEGIAVSATWVPIGDAADSAAGGELAVPLDFALLEPGQAREISFEAAIPFGLYSLTVTADSETPEVVTANNTSESELGVDYVDIAVTADPVFADDWTRAGNGIVTVAITATNRGQVPSRPAVLGVSCGADAGSGCDRQIDLPAIPVGSTREEVLSIQLPPGQHQLRAFAGTAQESHLWGPANIAQIDVDVPPQPAQRLVRESTWELSGYLADGNAKIELKTLLRNAGSEPLQEPAQLEVACQQDGLVLPNCGEAAALRLADGFGPEESTFELNVPMGAELFSALRGEWGGSADFAVPPRILGVERFVWDCYSDRVGGVSGCAGWDLPTVTKRPVGQAIRYWATGDPEYLSLLDGYLARLSELLGFEFEVAASREEAQLLAFVGAPKSAVADLGWGSCISGDGCASIRTQDGVINWGAFGVWHQGDLSDPQVSDRVRTALLRDLLHALTGIGYRNALDASIGRTFTPSLLEVEMLRLNSHPLVRPGMQVQDIHDLIVFRDELIAAPPPSEFAVAYRAVHDAIAELSAADSVRFELTSAGPRHCLVGNYSAAVYEIGDFGDALAAIKWPQIPNYVRFAWGDHDYVIDRGGFAFARTGGQWNQVDIQAPYQATGWWEGQSGIYALLHSFLRVTEPANISALVGPDGLLELRSVLGGERATKVSSITIDPQSDQIRAYGIETTIPGICDWSFRASSSEYGLGLTDLDEIRRLSAA